MDFFCSKVEATKGATVAVKVTGVKLVEKMPALQKERQSVRREDDLDRVRNLERQVARVDAEIDQRVYALYGLTEDEVKVVEGG